MNGQELKSLARSLTKLQSITDELWRKSLRNRATLIAMHGLLVETISTQTGQSKAEIKKALKSREREALQKLFENIEDLSPGLSAQLDNREPEEMP
jgi:hypothetical protein